MVRGPGVDGLRVWATILMDEQWGAWYHADTTGTRAASLVPMPTSREHQASETPLARKETVMAEATLEERVATLEHLVAQLLHPATPGALPKDWRRTVGLFAGDPIMREIIAAGQRVREADRQAAAS